eukprot:gene33099-44300_t
MGNKTSACNLYIEQLEKVGVNLLGNCVCGQPVGQHLHEPPTKRDDDGKMAFYRPSILMGNLQETVEDVENLLLENRIKESGMAKENLPFVCIVNPPRHGKSLFLDRIFKGRSDVQVIPMVYNNNSNLTDDDMHSPRRALFSFWLRFIGSVTGGGDGVVKYSLDWAKKIILQKFSKLTDRMTVKKWPKEDVLEFFSSLRNEKQLNPLIQFVFTGSNKEMSSRVCHCATYHLQNAC